VTIFNLDAVAHEDAREPWVFQADGKTWRLPHVADLTLGQQFAVDSGRLPQVLREVAEYQDGDAWKPGGRKGAELALNRHADQIATLTAAWLAHAGVEPGESEASSQS